MNISKERLREIIEEEVVNLAEEEGEVVLEPEYVEPEGGAATSEEALQSAELSRSDGLSFEDFTGRVVFEIDLYRAYNMNKTAAEVAEVLEQPILNLLGPLDQAGESTGLDEKKKKRKKKTDCFDHATHKTFKSKVSCVKRTKPGVKSPGGYVKTVVDKIGEK